MKPRPRPRRLPRAAAPGGAVRAATTRLQTTGIGEGNGFCKSCGTPAEDGKLCNHCGAVLDLPDAARLVEDQTASARRDFEGHTHKRQKRNLLC